MHSTQPRKTRGRIGVLLGLSALLVMFLGSAYGQEEVRLRMMHFRGVESGFWVTDRWTSEFEQQNPGIKLDIDHTPYNEIYEKMVIQFQGGKAPDVISAGRDQFGEFVGLRIMECLDPFIEKDPEIDLSQSLVAPHIKISGKTYMVGQEVGCQALYSNTRLLGERGLGIPNDWEELIQSAKKVMDPEKGIYGMTIPIHKGGLGYLLFDYYWPVLGANGGDIVKDNRAAFDSEVGVRTLEFLLDLDKKHHIVSPGVLSIKQIQIRQRFANEQDVFAMDGVWGIVPLGNMNPDLQYEVRRVFKGVAEPGASVGGSGLGMSTTSKHKEAAWKLIKYLRSKESMMWAGVTCLMPDRLDVLSEPLYQNQPHWKPFIESLVKSRPWYSWTLPKGTELQTHYLMAVQKVYLDMEPTQKALSEAAKKWNEILAAGF